LVSDSYAANLIIIFSQTCFHAVYIKIQNYFANSTSNLNIAHLNNIYFQSNNI